MPPPLPSGLRTDTLVEIVLNAQPDLSRKRAFREKLQSLLNSNLCSDILKSSFWWFYLDNFKPDKYKALGFNENKYILNKIFINTRNILKSLV